VKIKNRKKGRICIVEVSGEVKLPQGDQELRTEFKKLLDAEERLFLFDLLAVPWMDTAGIAETIACHKRAMDRGGIVKLVMKGKTHDLFTMYQLMKVFEIFEDLEEGLASFAE
jgi:anti-anti-sigma factor